MFLMHISSVPWKMAKLQGDVTADKLYGVWWTWLDVLNGYPESEKSSYKVSVIFVPLQPKSEQVEKFHGNHK
jgi:hypothetical protein